MAESGFFDPDTKPRDRTPNQWEDFLHKPATTLKVGGINLTYAPSPPPQPGEVGNLTACGGR